MKLRSSFVLIGLCSTSIILMAGAESGNSTVREEKLEAPGKVAVKIRMEGPYTADTPLQVVCYFKHKVAGDMTRGAPVELDKHLRGVITSLRNRGDFVGNELETLLLTAPPDSIKAKQLLLIGLGDEDGLSLATLERVGQVALREAARLGAARVAFAPLIRDQGNSKLGTGDVAGAVVRGVLLAYDTEKRLQKEGFAKEYTLEEWSEEAGPTYFDDTVAGMKKAIEAAGVMIAAKSSEPYATSK